MIRGFHAAASGLITQQTQLNTIANNIANVNTTAFKPQQAAFSSLLYEQLNGGAGNMITNGHGVKVQHTGLNFAQGTPVKTDRPTDLAILGEGFFAVESRLNERITYTRDGAFRYAMEDGDLYLVNGAGDYVLTRDGERLEIEEGKAFDPSEVGIFFFPNPYGLQPIGGNQYLETEISGEAEEIEDREELIPTVQVGYLESSAVQLSEEMVKMIEASKGFAFNSRVIQAADEMEKLSNQLR